MKRDRDNLKPCPFCGECLWVFRTLGRDDNGPSPCAYVCDGCGAQSPWVACARTENGDISPANSRRAADALNTRPIEDGLRINVAEIEAKYAAPMTEEMASSLHFYAPWTISPSGWMEIDKIIRMAKNGGGWNG